MKKIIFFTGSVLWAIVFFIWFNYYINISQNKKPIENKIIQKEINKLNPKIKIEEKNNTIISPLLIKTNDEKIQTLKKRFSLRGTIGRWDNFFGLNQLTLALHEYIKASKQNPKDEKIIQKLALTYFELKRFWESVEEFSKIENILQIEDIHKYILSLFYVTNYKSPESLGILSNKLENLPITEEERFYYINAMNSVTDFHASKKAYDDYFQNTWEIKFIGLSHIKNALLNFENFQSDNLYYKDALIIWALFQDKIFTISNILALNLLEEKPDYKAMILIVWKGYYELKDRKNAQIYLEKYYNIDSKDTSIAYMLWNIHFEKNDYVTSNLYYNAALKNWFDRKIEIQRKLVYNYYMLSDIRSMLLMFWNIVEEKDSTIDDFALWIYHAILEWKTSFALGWSEKWLKKFEWEIGYEVFYAYLWWITRENQEWEKSREYLSLWLNINPKNPLLTLNMWYLEEFEEKYMMALIYLKRTVNINGNGEFWELAKKEIIEIDKYLEILEKNKQPAESWTGYTQ